MTYRDSAILFGVILLVWELITYVLGPAIGITLNSEGYVITAVADALVLILVISLLVSARWAPTGAVIAGVVKLVTTLLGFIAGSAQSRISVSLYEPIVVSILSLLFIFFSIMTRNLPKARSGEDETEFDESAYTT